MFAQDTGSAIRGAARADIYFGHGEDIPHIAGRIKQFGKFVMLVPQGVDGLRHRAGAGQGHSAAEAAAEGYRGRAMSRPARRRSPRRGHELRQRRRGLSYEERVLWTTVTKAIEPLRARCAGSRPMRAMMQSRKLRSRSRAARLAKTIAIRAARAAKAGTPPLTPLSRRMKRSVARGKEQIDARLDLHGLTQSEAHAALAAFSAQRATRATRGWCW